MDPGYAQGMTVPQAFDSLLAKLIITGASRTEALQRARRALDECVVGGMPTVLPFHRAVVRDPAFTDEPFRVHTRWIETEFGGAIEPWSGPAGAQQDGGLNGQAGGPAQRERITVEVSGKRLEVVLPAGFGLAEAPPAAPAAGAADGGRPGGGGPAARPRRPAATTSRARCRAPSPRSLRPRETRCPRVTRWWCSRR